MDNSYTDDRGTIKDLLVTDDYSITHITFNKGAVRGNHYHEHTDQVDVILKGSLTCSIDKGKFDVYPNEKIEINRGKSHAYKAHEYSEIISICFGVRKGADYEKDVIRLKEPLL
jgi:mannose-6-phosphate isomerase-like protein (cupin superfamily)